MTTFRLEQFCAMLIPATDGQSTPIPHIVQTPGIRPEQVFECRRLAYLPPPTNPNDEMSASLGLFRGETTDYILAKSQNSADKLPCFQYVLMSSSVLAQLKNNIRKFETFAREPISSDNPSATDLPPFILDDTDLPDDQTQLDYLQAFVTYCKHNLQIVGKLLAALVQAISLEVINAPPSLSEQITFIRGFLLLLPASIRYEITFAIGVTAPTQLNAQIKFLTVPPSSNQAVIFDWATGAVLGQVTEDAYTRYVVAQLRLDASLALEHTEKLIQPLPRTEGADLAHNLAEASRRAILENAVQHGLPVERKRVAEALQNGSALPNDLRIAYTRHLLALSLVLNEPDDVDNALITAAKDSTIADVVYTQLKAAAASQSLAVYNFIERWLTQTPTADELRHLIPLLETATVAHTQDLADSEAPDLVEFLERLLELPPGLELQSLIAQIIKITRQLGTENLMITRLLAELSKKYLPEGKQRKLLDYFVDNTFVKYLSYVSSDELQQLPTMETLFKHLPDALRSAFLAILSPTDHPGTAESLLRGAEVYGPEQRPLILARLMELALLNQQPALLDRDAAQALIDTKHSQTTSFGEVFQKAVDQLADFLRSTEVPAAPVPAAVTENVQSADQQVSTTARSKPAKNTFRFLLWVCMVILGVLLIGLLNIMMRLSALR